MRGRSPSDTATSPFPLNDIDYESSAAGLAQELSNLQALRRMSMDVAAAGDPDLPAMNGGPAIPSIAPSPSSSEDDTSRLFWVPARLHPELAPKEFKSFLESKAEQIKRRSGEFSFDSEGTASRSGSLSAGSSLRRKKSMLSRQIDKGEGYQDGAERLERKRSHSQRNQAHDPNLEELESLVTDASKLQRLSLESMQYPQGEGPAEDMPILPTLGPGSSLRRSTRTTYRRGSQTKKLEGGRMTFSKRMQEAEERRKAAAAAASAIDPPNITTFVDSTSEDLATKDSAQAASASSGKTLNFSRPARSPTETTPKPAWDSEPSQAEQPTQPSTPAARQWQSSISSHGRSTLQIAPENQTVPHIVVETPLTPEETTTQPPTSVTTPASAQNRLPERTSSYQSPQQQQPQRTSSATPPPISARSPARPGMPPRSKSPQTLDQISSNPSPLPGNDNKTNDLSFIPTLTEDKKADSRKLKDKKDDSRKSSWNWLLGKEESDKEKRKEEEAIKRPKAKITKPPEKHENTRLDVLQSSIDSGNKGRESLVLDRESVKLEEERKKESARKSSGNDSKKEKDGLFSSIFGGGKKKGDGGKKFAGRALSPEPPPPRQLKPDIDYNWTRFSLLEERAIYRMAHMKLANPRRALYSQVLLSNFMYSYLAKVQQMHPQMNLPTSAKQQQQQKQKKDQPDEFTQYQRYQEQQAQQQSQQQSQQEYARQKMSGQGYNRQYQQDEYGDYGEDSSMYDYDNDGRNSRGSKHGHENGGSYGGGGGYYQHSDFGDEIQGDDDDW
ncbi:putative telomere silencing protein [Phaeomoniella chlamydospora]|uniref:Putative telomere silencing protein n=1 Tax=Phaeomoniella chlamydospora TaxID=158046 RepID=A0A0G2G0L3_PHACM|nr:putative telomere silencing protein [Phaeomoniella chlamydospora]